MYQLNRALLDTKLIDIVNPLLKTLLLKSEYTAVHCFNVADFSYQISKKLNIEGSELKRIYLAGLLHDVGKILIPDKILNKPGPLNQEEYSVICEHPTFSARIIEDCPLLQECIPLLVSHHENYDGSGYPAGIKGEDIPVGGRILALADAFDAMTSFRPYRAPLSIKEAMTRIEQGLNGQFDPKLGRITLTMLQSASSSGFLQKDSCLLKRWS